MAGDQTGLADDHPGDAMIALLVVTDGRDDYLRRCVTSTNERLHGPIGERWMFDDTGNPSYRTRLAARFPRFRHIHGGPRQGFGGAIAAAWQHLAQHSHADWVFHLEQDFVFRRRIDLDAMAAVLQARPYLRQMALRRQAWNAAEQAAGGVVERHPDAYRECRDDAGRAWLEHRLFWTTNPSLYRRSTCSLGWPVVSRSEGVFTRRMLADPAARFGYWGARDSGVWVEHVGHQRSGTGY